MSPFNFRNKLERLRPVLSEINLIENSLLVMLFSRALGYDDGDNGSNDCDDDADDHR